MATEADDLAFRHRTLLAAQRILDAEFRAATHPHRDDLYVQRLRRLRAYLRNSITSLERRMESLGIARPDAAGEENDGEDLPPAGSPMTAREAERYGPSSASE